jgi:hypothetical protein
MGEDIYARVLVDADRFDTLVIVSRTSIPSLSSLRVRCAGRTSRRTRGIVGSMSIRHRMYRMISRQHEEKHLSNLVCVGRGLPFYELMRVRSRFGTECYM